MATLILSDYQARKIYPSASTELKTILDDTFGKSFFYQKITDRIKTFEDACNETGDDPKAEHFNTGAPDEIAYRKLKVIIKALNEGWAPDWGNLNERKWFPWFSQYGSSAFCLGGVVGHCARPIVGSRLFFKSEELVQHAAKYFLNYYKDFYTS